MKKKLIIVVLLVLCVTCLIFALSACGIYSPPSKPDNAKQCRVSIKTTSGGEATKLYGNYVVGEQVIVEAKTYLGYDWCGWYIDDTLLSTDLNYTIVIPSVDTVYTAKWEVKQEMEMFIFGAKTDSCNIVELKNKALTEVVVPDYVTDIQGMAFNNCDNLEKITVDSNNKKYSSQDGVLYNKEKTKLLCVPKAIKGAVTIPKNVAEISEGAFKNRSNLTSITISEKITSIGDNAFSGCSSLSNVNWNATNCFSAGAWGSGCIFKDCVNLQSIIIGENVFNIPDFAFFGCTGLTSIILPKSISIIGKDSFYGCSSLSQVNWNIVNWDDVYHSTTGLFKDCINLKTIIIGENVTLIPNYVFSGCSRVTSVIIGKKVASIGYSAFQNCSELTNITIPKSVTEIGEYSFNGCNLTNINYEGTKAEWNAIKKGFGWDMRTSDYIIHCTDGQIAKN